MVAIYAAIDFLAAFIRARQITAHYAHLGGLVMGFILLFSGIRPIKKLSTNSLTIFCCNNYKFILISRTKNLSWRVRSVQIIKISQGAGLRLGPPGNALFALFAITLFSFYNPGTDPALQ